jgi:hypothetical protein
MPSKILLHVCVAFCVASSSVARAGDMEGELKLDPRKPRDFKMLFGTYGYREKPAVFPEVGGVRFRLPGGVSGVAQSGVYSYFVLAGDCEVTCRYEIIGRQLPQTGFGSGIGLAFDVGDGDGHGTIRREFKPKGVGGYLLETRLRGKDDQLHDEQRFVPAAALQGWLGLRRIKDELIFLASNNRAGPPEEIDRLPFPDGTIQAVRFYAEPGGAPTPVDGRFNEITALGEEITGGQPKTELVKRSWWWLWLLVGGAGGGWLFRRWRAPPA